MLHRYARIALLLLAHLNYRLVIGEKSLPKENDKLSDNSGLRMCYDSFDIHNDKIIRTQDSQEMGAKYLNEVDLESRQECLRLCCETDECDVFIFEEKKPGSCYLFHCGPPHDFKCKFTSHANYSSAVLTNINYRSTAQLEEQIRRTQQEHELKSLRKLAETVPLEYSYTEPPPLPVTEPPKTSVITTAIPIKTGCSRNQYECRTSGDCIAIYNVCDGIPQCADGSDEASELGCPTERPTIPSSPIIHAPLVPQTSEILKYPPLIPHHKSYAPAYNPSDTDSAPKLWQFPVAPHQAMAQQPANSAYSGHQIQPSIPQMNYGSQGYVGGWDYRQMYEQNKESPYNAANPMHMKNDAPQYDPDQLHIFKHKNSGLVVQNGVPEGPSYIDSNRPYGSYYPIKNHGTWQEGEPRSPLHPPESPTPSPPKIQHERIPITEQPKSTIAPVLCKPPATDFAKDSPKPSISVKKEHETSKTAHSETAENRENAKPAIHENPQDSRIEPKVDKTQDHDEIQRKNKIPEVHRQPEVRVHHYVAEHLQQNNHHEEADALRPSGAVISLALGLTVTGIMAVLIACRLRVVRRRGRRGHSPYAHDADYLVNGMYL